MSAGEHDRSTPMIDDVQPEAPPSPKEHPPLGHTQSLLLSCMFIFQFFHWFKPSEPFFADYVLPHYTISMRTLVSDIYAWDTLFQILSATLLLAVFVLLGARASLMICALASLCTVLCVILFDSVAMLLLSQALWAMSFTAIFLVPAVLYQYVEHHWHFQLVSSLNNGAMLCASLQANLLGFILSEADRDMVCGTSSSARYRITFFFTLGSGGISLLVLLLAFRMNWVPPQEPKATSVDHESSFLLQLRANLSCSTLLLWVMVSAVTRAVHTQVTTLWPLVSLQIAPECNDQRFNALISFSAYLGAAVVVAFPARFSQFTAAHGRFAVAPCLLVCSVLLITISHASSLWQLGYMLLAYHSCSELMLTIASAQIAHAALRAANRSTLKQQMGIQYMSAMAAKYVSSLLVEMLLLLTIWPRWGQLENVFGLKLDVREQIRALGVVLIAALAIAVAILCKEMLHRIAVRQCANYEHIVPRV